MRIYIFVNTILAILDLFQFLVAYVKGDIGVWRQSVNKKITEI